MGHQRWLLKVVVSRRVPAAAVPGGGVSRRGGGAFVEGEVEPAPPIHALAAAASP
jgi:hypothetical protein